MLNSMSSPFLFLSMIQILLVCRQRVLPLGILFFHWSPRFLSPMPQRHPTMMPSHLLLMPSHSTSSFASEESCHLHASSPFPKTSSPNLYSPSPFPYLALPPLPTPSPNHLPLLPPNPHNNHPMTTHSKNLIFKPKHLYGATKHPFLLSLEPTCVSQAVCDPH